MSNPHAGGKSTINVAGFYSLRQLAEELNVSESYVYVRAQKNMIPTVQICGSGARLVPNHLVAKLKRGIDISGMDPTAVPDE